MGFFDRLYYGKAGKADYTTDDLPKNRFQLFFEVLRVRFWSLMRVNLMQVVFWIPFIFWTSLNVHRHHGAFLGGGGVRHAQLGARSAFLCVERLQGRVQG